MYGPRFKDYGDRPLEEIIFPQDLEIDEFIFENNIPYDRKVRIGDRKVDFILNNKLIIEYVNMLRFGKCMGKYYYIDAYNEFTKDGYEYLMIFEDEWRNRENCFKNLILNRIGNKETIKLRPKKCEIKLISNKDVEDFYEKFHYQGSCISKYNIGVFYNENLIACLSIKSPTRQKSGDWEISRMSCDYKYRINGIWTYLMKWIRENNLISGKLITFSDNRLMTGKVYHIMGFEHVNDLKPDYYWALWGKRFHKSSMRKRGEEKKLKLTETQLREAEGFYKVWDLGKKKWEMTI